MWKSDFTKTLLLILVASVVGVAAFGGCYSHIYSHDKSSFSIMSPSKRQVKSSESLPAPPTDSLSVGNGNATGYELPDFFCYSLAVWTGLGAADVVPSSLKVRFFTGLESFVGIIAFVFCVALAGRIGSDGQSRSAKPKPTTSDTKAD